LIVLVFVWKKRAKQLGEHEVEKLSAVQNNIVFRCRSLWILYPSRGEISSKISLRAYLLLSCQMNEQMLNDPPI